MDVVNNVAAASIANTAERVGDAVTISTLKKSLDIQQQTADGLIAALPDAPAPRPEGSMGHNLDVKA